VLTYLDKSGTEVKIKYLGELSKVQQAVFNNNDYGDPYLYQDPEIQAWLSHKLVQLPCATVHPVSSRWANA
jgi:hypothetical protein